MYKIYIVRNTVNGKIYVGQTHKTVKERWKQHVKASNHKRTYFYSAIQKYGPGSFVVRMIDSTRNRTECNMLEMAYICLYQATNPELGYNSTVGGDGNPFPSQYTRQKMAESQKRRLADPRNHPQYGKSISAEQKRAMVAGLQTKVYTPEERAAQTKENLRRWSDPEYKARQSGERNSAWKDTLTPGIILPYYNSKWCLRCISRELKTSPAAITRRLQRSGLQQERRGKGNICPNH